MALSAFGVEDSRLIAKFEVPGMARVLHPVTGLVPTLKAMPGGVKAAFKTAPSGVGNKTKAVLAVRGVKPTLGVAAGGAGIAALGNGHRNNQPAY